MHVGNPPFDARNVSLGPGRHTIHVALGDSSHRTFHQPTVASITFAVAAGFRGRGALEPACAEVARGSGEVRLAFPFGGGVAQGSVRTSCTFKTDDGACEWRSDSVRRMVGTYDAASRAVTGTLTGSATRTLSTGGRSVCGTSSTTQLDPAPFEARVEGDVVRGAIGQSRFVVRSAPSADIDLGPVRATAAAKRRSPWPFLLLVPVAVLALALLRVRTRARRLHEAPSDATAACERCGADVRERARFCSQCGTAVGAGRPSMSGTVPPVVRSDDAVSNRIHREGEFWTITFAGDVVRLRDTRGLHHLAHLLTNPGREFHVLDLVAAAEGSAPDASGEEPGLRPDVADAPEVLDAEARDAYRRRLADLDDELREAESWNDTERASRIAEEMDALRTELAAGVGLGGRSRRAASPAERARVSVFRALRSAMQRIEQAAPELGRHLGATIRTGTFCSYIPDPSSATGWTRA